MRKKKRGRPRRGHDPMIGLRVPMAILRKIDKLADALSMCRSGAVRWAIEQGINSGLAILLLRSSGGRRAVDRVCAIASAEVKAVAAERAVKRAAPPSKVDAEIKALRAREHLSELAAAEVDRLALASVLKKGP